MICHSKVRSHSTFKCFVTAERRLHAEAKKQARDYDRYIQYFKVVDFKTNL